MLLAKARERGGTERVWMKSAIVERESGNTDEERRLLYDGLKRFPSFFKLWLMLGQLEERLSYLERAKEVYESGLKQCSSCVPLWLSLAKMEEKMNGLSKARAVLTMARKKNPESPELWLAAVRAESRHGIEKEADILMAKALQVCPNSGILWAASIEMVLRPQRRTKSMDALKRCNHDPHVIAAIAKLFWHDRNVDKARSWLDRAVTLGPDIGDFWALFCKFELQHGTKETQEDVLKRCIAAEPKYGERWEAVSKAVENSHQPTEAILKKVVVALGKEETSAEGNKQWIHFFKDEDIAPKALKASVRVVTLRKQQIVYSTLLMFRLSTPRIGDSLLPDRGARVILQEAYAAIPYSEEIWLAAFKLEFENHEPERARMLLAKARERAGTERVWMKSAIVERESENMHRQGEEGRPPLLASPGSIPAGGMCICLQRVDPGSSSIRFRSQEHARMT
ncbi:hypothetical protein RHMOL_Rhmol05G0039200 [Rhododendron molle]|uniref:Uncharacterized protein n=1 Tax=Rhododendron molle TaxID=49168 RepID=A0ACC0NLH9_RHOML|nr:hypothetical protein RHMOL_Rhmol05G0039200 [Rhododendron molle]